MFKSQNYTIILFLILFNSLFSQEVNYKFTGKMYFPQNVLQDKVVDLAKDKYSIEENIQNAINGILDFYSNSGFPLCTAQVIELKNFNETVNCTIEINSGAYIRISFIEFQGLKVCDKDFMLKVSRLNIGSEFIEREIISAVNYLHKTELFLSKPDYSIVKKNGRLGLLIKLKEKKYFKGMFLGGINNSDNGSKFTGTGEFLAENIFGKNRKAGVKWFKKNDNDEKVHLMYREPFLFSLPISNRLIFEQENINLSYLKRKYEIFTDWTIDPESDIFICYSQESIYPDSTNTVITSDVKTNRYEGGMQFSTIYSSGLIPSEAGYSVFGSVSSINTEFVGKDSSSTAIQLNIKFKNIFNISKKIFYTVNNEYSQVFSSSSIDSFSKIVFGGAFGLRGYRDESFLSDIKIISESEAIFTPVDDLGFGLFFDVAAFNPDHEKISKIRDLDLKFGYGIILSYLQKSNEIQFTIGIPGDAGFSGSMVHVKYSYRF